MIPIRFAFASSQLGIEDSDITYDVENLYDGDTKTAYVEGVPGNGIGELIEIDFDNESSYEVGMIRIYPGYQKDESTFKKNARPAILTFYFPDGHCVEQELDYANETAGYFDIDLTKIFTGHVVAHHCIIGIDDAYPGDKYEDCCISEVEFYSLKTPDEDVVLIGYETEYEESGEKCLIKATKNGKSLWEYECKTEQVTELDGVGYITTANGVVFVQDDWQVVALDENTGDVLWKSNTENGFSVSASTYDVTTGNIYVSGYYGPTLIGFDKDGKELSFDTSDIKSYWPCMMVPDGEVLSTGVMDKGINGVRIYFDGDMMIESIYL